MNVEIESKGNSTFKVTITANGDVRIKLQQGSDAFTRDTMINRLKRVAQEAIRDQLNTGTLRGKCKVSDQSITLCADNKKPVKKFQF